MKKIIVLALILLSTETTPLLASARQHGTSHARDKSPEPSCHSCGLWRVLFSCCCKPKVVEAALVSIDIVHAAIEVVLLGAPGAIREIYLLCQSAGYALSRAAVDVLNSQGFLDDRGNLKPGWREHILQLLSHDGTAAGPEEFYFEKSIEDLKIRYPEIIYQLEIAAKAENVYVPEMLTTLLHDQYHLIGVPSKITLEEMHTIVNALKKEDVENKHTRLHGPTNTCHFVLRSVDEATAPGPLVNSLIIS